MGVMMVYNFLNFKTAGNLLHLDTTYASTETEELYFFSDEEIEAQGLNDESSRGIQDSENAEEVPESDN